MAERDQYLLTAHTVEFRDPAAPEFEAARDGATGCPLQGCHVELVFPVGTGDAELGDKVVSGAHGSGRLPPFQRALPELPGAPDQPSPVCVYSTLSLKPRRSCSP